MRVAACATLTLALVVAVAAAQVPTLQPAGAEPQLKDLKQKVSYIFGMSMAKQIAADDIEVDPDLVVKGLQDGMSGAKPLMTPEEMQAAMAEFEKVMLAKQAEQQAEQEKMAVGDAEKNKKEGAAFLVENSKKQGIVTLPSGMQYEVLKDGGGGPSPTASSTVTAHYEGKLLNGNVFDSSYRRGEPIDFPLNGVIKGWTEGLQKMKVGDKFRLFIPSDLAYGDRGHPPVIPPGSLLVFDVELLGVK